MSTLEFLPLQLESIPQEHRAWMEKVFQPLNKFGLEAQEAVNAGASLSRLATVLQQDVTIPSEWQELELLNGTQTWNATTDDAPLCRWHHGRIELTGLLRHPSSGVLNLARLPVGYEPFSNIALPGEYDFNWAILYVTKSSRIINLAAAGSAVANSHFTLHGASFRANSESPPPMWTSGLLWVLPQGLNPGLVLVGRVQKLEGNSLKPATTLGVSVDWEPMETKDRIPALKVSRVNGLAPGRYRLDVAVFPA